jgi:hypothetical protein
VTGQYAFRESIQAAIAPSLWNGTAASGNAACIAAKPASEAWQCWFAQYLFPYLGPPLGTDVPLFILNSMYDTASLELILGLPCDPWTNCDAAQLAIVQDFHWTLRANISAALAVFGPRDGAFATACLQHEESCRDFDFFGIAIGGQTPNSTFTSFYYGPRAAGGAPTRQFDGLWPNNTSCPPPTADNGGC